MCDAIFIPQVRVVKESHEKIIKSECLRLKIKINEESFIVKKSKLIENV